jgi:hydroxyacid-oxoacid transhydrogenase
MRSSTPRSAVTSKAAVSPGRQQHCSATGGLHPPGCSCPQHRAMAMGLQLQGDPVFAIEASNIRFGRGALLELGAAVTAALHSLHSTRCPGRAKVALFTDVNVRASHWYQEAEHRLRGSLPLNTDIDVWDDVQAEPTLRSLLASSHWLSQSQADIIVSIGGGSVIDTAKACSLLSPTLASHPPPPLDQPPEAAFLTYFNAPVGGACWPLDAYGRAAKLRPHIACPTTAGTGSECTGIAIFDVEHLKVKVPELLVLHCALLAVAEPFFARPASPTPNCGPPLPS